MIWSTERGPTSGRRSMKRFVSYNSDQHHKTPSDLKQQKVDVTSKSLEYFDASHSRLASSQTVVLALPSCKALDVSETIMEGDSPGTKSYNLRAGGYCSKRGNVSKYQKSSSRPRSLSVEVRRNHDCKMGEMEDREICNFTSCEGIPFQSSVESLDKSTVGDEAKLGHAKSHSKKRKSADTWILEQQSTPIVQGKRLRSRNKKTDNVVPIIERSDDCRKQVLDVLQHFKDVCHKLLEESKADANGGVYAKGGVPTRAASLLRKQQKWMQYTPTFGSIPGVEIGDTYQFRAELAIVGLHLQYVAGVDYTNLNGECHATSIVDSGHCENKFKSLDTLIYVGSGSNHKASRSSENLEDQKLEKGNLALKNSMDSKLPIRVICLQKTLGLSGQGYTYAGLYIVSNYKQERDQKGQLVFKFELSRLHGQPNLTLPVAWDWEAIGSGVSNRVVVDDVSQGKEKFPIPAMNDIDNEKPPPFTYITKMIKPSWFNCSLPEGCNCKNGCSDSKPCPCTHRNGGEIPFNSRGSIVKAKPVIYLCGPSCKCPPSCKNRVGQKGPRYHFEVFKTKSRGWGLRSRDRITSGSFICEYIGELLDEKEAEKRIDCDEYLFDIGNYDEGENLHIDDIHRKDSEGFTIDAARFGNVGRFINHSCSPNLYAQNCLFDHDYKRAPHLMLFAQEDIPPMQELTYDYNYKIDQVRDSNGNLKKKNCYCGFPECIGRLY